MIIRNLKNSLKSPGFITITSIIKFLFFALFILNGFMMQAQDDGIKSYPGTKPKSVVAFKELKYNFGEMPLNAEVQHSFEFKNVSKERINIREVTTSCGCTTPTYSISPVKPHRIGKVIAKYDSSHPGHFLKSLTVTISDNEKIELLIEGDIVKK